ncbi:protein 4.1-like, partial [Sinocyclocheilus grahami]|uniref:protein 4.1-like n=1 Tax=Sinocyclocheilus grahami TaxID=75366 RepID=UPI0007AD3442
YLLCLQLRKDIVIGRLLCPSDILALLGSYTVQSTLGNYDPNLHQNNYVSEIVLAPNQSEELEERIMELHSTYRFMSPAQADMLFLENAIGLPMYGVDLHPAKDVNGADVMLGVCSEGLMVYEDEIKTNIFLWPRVLKISHKRSTFLLKMRPSEEDEFEGAISFSLASYRACKQLWKCCVEHHSFFRNRLQDTKTKRLLTLGSRFRFHGRTQSECLEACGNITRAPPRFTRFIIKRKGNEEILDVLKQPVQTELDDWFLVYGPDKWRISTSGELVEVEELRFGLQEVESLEQRLQQVEKEELQRAEKDDWYILLDRRPLKLTATPTGGVQEELQQIVYIPQPMKKDDDWYILFDVLSKTMEMSRFLQVTVYIIPYTVMTVSAKEQIIVPEKKRTSIIQTPQFPVVPGDFDDDWLQLFDKVPYEQKSFPSDVRGRDFEVHEPIKDQRVQIVVEEQMREKRLITEEKRVIIDEHRERADVVAQMVSVGVREVHDDWFELLDAAPPEMRSVPSVAVATEERRMKEQEDSRVRQQQMRVREEEEKRLRELEKRKQELELRRAQPAVTVKTEAQPQIEKDDDWFILFDVSPKETVAPPKPRPQIPADQPLTSTPTTQPVSITKTNLYKNQERTKDLWNITPETEQSATESVLMRKTRRSEGESIYIRHSSLMLEDFDVSHEMILKHYASISELKHGFMEVKQDFGPTEWDRRLSSYSPTSKAQFPHANEEILVRMGLIEEDGKTVLFRSQEIIYV